VHFFSADYYKQMIWIRIMGLMVFLGGLVAVAWGKQFSLYTRRLFLAVFLLTPVGIIYQSIFPGSLYDLVLIGILFCASALDNRPASLIFDLAGLLVHEAYLFLRLPFIVFNLISSLSKRGKERKFNLFTLFSLGAIVSEFIIMISNWARRDRAVLEKNYEVLYPHLPVHNLNHLRAFDPIAKEATIGFQVNQMITSYHRGDFRVYLLLMFGCGMMIGLLTYLFNNLKGRPKRMDIIFSLGSFLSPLLLCFVGLDYGRWINFAFITWICYYVLFRQKLFSDAILSTNCLYGMLMAAYIIYPTVIYEHPLMFVLSK
jgi:hypothetical protein